MAFLTLEDYIQMGEMGRGGILKKIRKIHSKIVRKIVPKPLRKLDPMYKAPKKKTAASAPVSQDVASVPPPAPPAPIDASQSIPGPVVTDPSLVASGAGPGMPQSIPIASAPAAAPLPPTGQSAPSPFPTGSSSPSDDASYDEDINFDDETSDDGDADYGSNSPVSEPADPEADYQSDIDRFVEDQTNTQLNEPEGRSHRGKHDDTIDGWYDPEDQVNTQLGTLVPHRAGRNIFQVRMPRYRQADIFDRKTNPHLYRKGRYQGGLVRQGRQSVNPRTIARRKVKVGNASGVSGFLPETPQQELAWGLAGWGLWATSAMLPRKYRSTAKVAGMGAIVITGFQLLGQLLSQKKKPDTLTVSGVGDDGAVDPALLSLAKQTQAIHQSLIESAAGLTTTEQRRPVRDKLDQLKQDFVSKAMAITGVSAPLEWAGSTDQNYVLAYSVQRDIADTESRLAALAEGEVLQKDIVAVINSDGSVPNPPSKDLIPTWVKWAVGGYIAVEALKAVKK